MTFSKIGQSNISRSPKPDASDRPYSTTTTEQLAQEFVKYSDSMFGTYREDQDQLAAILKEIDYRGREEKKSFVKIAYKKFTPLDLDLFLNTDQTFRQKLKLDLAPDFIRGALVRKNMGWFDRTQMARLLEIWEGKEIYRPDAWDARLAGTKNVIDQSRHAKTFLGTGLLYLLLPPQGKLVMAAVLGFFSFKHGSEKIEKNVAKSLSAPENSKEAIQAKEGIMEGFLQTILPFIPFLKGRTLRSSQTSNQTPTEFIARSNIPRSEVPQMSRGGIPTESGGMVLKGETGSTVGSNSLATQSQTSFQVVPTVSKIPVRKTIWHDWAVPPRVKTKSAPNNPENYEMPGIKGPEMGSPKPDPSISIIGFPGSLKNDPMVDPKPAEEQGPIGDSPSTSDPLWMSYFDPFPTRDYQELAIQAFFKIILEYRDRGLIVLPTGTGKTITFADLVGLFVAEFPKPLRTLVISHREEILEQNAKKIGRVVGEENVGVVQAEREEWDKPVVMASIQTLIQKDPALLNQFDLIVLDEAHHYVHGNEWFNPLIHLGFFTPEGEIRYNPNRLLVGFTATPDRFTGKPLNTTFGVDGMIFEKDITWMIDRSHLLQPYGIEVNLEVPGATNPADALKMASPEEKARIIAEIFYDRLHHGDKFKRTMVFVSPRTDQNSPNEVGIVTEHLNQVGIRAAGITDETVWKIENGKVVSFNGSKAAGARKEVIAAYKRGEYDALVNVNIATEGFDDEGTEAVIVARAIESRGMFVQIIGRALRPDPNHPERTTASLVDLGGNFQRHRLNINIQESYRTSQGKLKQATGPTGPTGPRAARVQGQQTIESFEINDLGQIVPGSRRSAFSITLEELLPTPEAVQELAYRLGRQSDKLFRYYNSNSIPLNFEEVSQLSQAIHDSEEKLLDAWASDQAILFAQKNPIPENLSEGEKEVLRLARFGFFRYQRGYFSEARKLGAMPDTLRDYLEKATIPNKTKENFYWVLVQIIARAGEEEKGWEMLRKHFDGVIFGESWRPTNIKEFNTVGEDKLISLRHIFGFQSGETPEVIILQFQLKTDGHLYGFKAVRPGEENSGDTHGKVQLHYLEDGGVEVEKGWGSGVDEVVKKLKESAVYKNGWLKIRSRGWLRLGTGGKAGFYLNDLTEMKDSDLKEFRRWLRDSSGAEPRMSILQFHLTTDGHLNGFKAVRPGEENSAHNYSKVQLHYLEDGGVEVEKGWGQKVDEVIEKLKESAVYKNGWLKIRSRGWLRWGTAGRSNFHLNDLKEMRSSDLEEFRRRLRDLSGAEPGVIILQFGLKKDGGDLRGFTMVRPGEENSAHSYGKVQLRYLEKNYFKVTKVWGYGHRQFLEALRQSPITQGEDPVLRIELEE